MGDVSYGARERLGPRDVARHGLHVGAKSRRCLARIPRKSANAVAVAKQQPNDQESGAPGSSDYQYWVGHLHVPVPCPNGSC